MPNETRAAVEALLPVTIPQGNIRYAPGIRAGRWIFATGHKGVTDYRRGLSDAVLRASLPQWDKSKLKREAEQIFKNVAAVLEAGGSELRNVVRVDQNYTTHKAVEPYHDTRRAVLKDHIPPSTSTLTQRLLLGGQEIEVHMIAIVPKGDFKPEHIRPGDHAVHATSGYSLALAAEDYVFVAGRMADEIRRRRVEVIHAHQYTPFFYAALAKLRVSPAPKVIFTEHGRHYPDIVSIRLLLSEYSVAVAHLRTVARLAAATVDGAAEPLREARRTVHRLSKTMGAAPADLPEPQ